MRNLLFIVFCLLTLSSCGQTKTANSQEVFDKMISEICSCSQTIPLQKTSTQIDYCYKLSIKNNYKILQQLGIDSSTEAGRLKLYNELLSNRLRLKCKDVYSKLMQEFEVTNQSKLTFTGKFISQTPNYEKKYYVLILESKQTKDKKEFHSNIQVLENEQNDDITVEYEVVKNKQTNEEELIVKTISSVGIRPVKKEQ